MHLPSFQISLNSKGQLRKFPKKLWLLKEWLLKATDRERILQFIFLFLQISGPTEAMVENVFLAKFLKVRITVTSYQELTALTLIL
jgi:hypothetical protein